MQRRRKKSNLRLINSNRWFEIHNSFVLISIQNNGDDLQEIANQTEEEPHENVPSFQTTTSTSRAASSIIDDDDKKESNHNNSFVGENDEPQQQQVWNPYNSCSDIQNNGDDLQEQKEITKHTEEKPSEPSEPEPSVRLENEPSFETTTSPSKASSSIVDDDDKKKSNYNNSFVGENDQSQQVIRNPYF